MTSSGKGKVEQHGVNLNGETTNTPCSHLQFVQRNELSKKQVLKRQRKERKLEHCVAKSRSAAYDKMELQNERLKKLENAEAHLIVEKHVRVKGHRRKIAEK